MIEEITLNTNGPLVARNRKAWDKITQGKMTKKLKKLFYDKQIPSHRRDKIPVICDDDGVLYVPTVVVRDGAKCKNGSTIIRVFKINN